VIVFAGVIKSRTEWQQPLQARWVAQKPPLRSSRSLAYKRLTNRKKRVFDAILPSDGRKRTNNVNTMA
jgi:hypothetical protein